MSQGPRQKSREKKKLEGTIWCCINFQKVMQIREKDRNKADIAFSLQTGVAEEDLVRVYRLGR